MADLLEQLDVGRLQAAGVRVGPRLIGAGEWPPSEQAQRPLVLWEATPRARRLYSQRTSWTHGRHADPRRAIATVILLRSLLGLLQAPLEEFSIGPSGIESHLYRRRLRSCSASCSWSSPGRDQRSQVVGGKRVSRNDKPTDAEH